MPPADHTRTFDEPPLAGGGTADRPPTAAGGTIEECVRRYPALTDENVVSLIASEVRFRRRRGEHPEAGDYVSRFPHLARQLAGLFGAADPAGLTLSGDATDSTKAGPASDPPAAPPEVPGLLVTDLVGRGGMGVVFRAIDPALGRDVAVKVLRDHYPVGGLAARRFVEEAQITGQLQHPGIPPVHQVGTLSDGRPFLVMKLIKGNTLAELLASRERDRPEVSKWLGVFEGVCQAVGYAHARRVIHRDLKPANVMVGAFGEVQVMDWGLAKVLDDRRPKSVETAPNDATEIRTLRDPDSATLAGSILGTPAYMPPEQAGGEVNRVDERSDVFGLGAVLCQILTGQPPYVGPNADAVRLMAIRGQLAEAFARLGGCGADPELTGLCQTCLAADPAGRPRTAGEVAQALAAFRTAAEARARQMERDAAVAAARFEEAARRRRWQLIAGGVAGLAVLGGGGVAWWLDRQEAARRIENTRRQADAERQEEAERGRLARNAEATAALLDRCEDALRADDSRRAGVALEQAERRMGEGGTDTLRPRFDRCRADYDLLFELDRLENLACTWTEKGFQDDKAVAGTRQVFARLGLTPGASTEAVARQIRDSLIRERLVAALDWWFVLDLDQRYITTQVAVLRTVDPDPFRDAFRAASAVRNHDEMRKLAASPDADRQPARYASILGRCKVIPADRRERLLRHLLTDQPGNFRLLDSLAQLYPVTDAGVSHRIGWYRAAAAARPDNPRVWCNLGQAAIQQKDPAGAVEYYRRAIRADDKYAEAHAGLGVSLAKTGERDAAIASYRETLRLSPDYPFVHNNLGWELLQRGEVNDAIKHLKEAVRLDAGYATAQYNLSVALVQIGDVVGAAGALKEAMRLDPGLKTVTAGFLRLRDVPANKKKADK